MTTSGMGGSTGSTSKFRFSGLVHPDSKFHQLEDEAPPDHVIPPKWVTVPGGKKVAQYADTVYGKSNGCDPPNDCQGYFMSAKFQPNNNCYAYGCVIASNSFPQPGRLNGYLLPAPFTGENVVHGATLDGLIDVGPCIADVRGHAASAATGAPSHNVALLISAADSALGWPGDYHWVRMYGMSSMSWSQKDGTDQVTNFDFAGNPISDPKTANWTVNQGPISTQNPGDLVVSYDFHTYMYVPQEGVNII